ncbi:ATP-binding cassette domain-containing protein, partial [Vibrio parahaemolyticus]|nr:ATP-binding cassette domain-containing protein [Vibrio parahaemolyticus]
KLSSPIMPALEVREIVEAAYRNDESMIFSAAMDLAAVRLRDPAVDKYSTPLLYLKGFHALQAYRIGNWLWKEGRQALAVYLQNQISVSFGDKQVLKDVSFELNKGDIVTLLGPNGAGKSTIVRVVLGLLPPTSGSIERASSLAIGYVPQKLHLDTTLPLTVKRFMLLKLGVRQEHLLPALERVNATHLLEQPM